MNGDPIVAGDSAHKRPTISGRQPTMPSPFVIEIGMGVDLHGADPTKASVRAVRDAIGRLYLSGLRQARDQGSRITVLVRLAVPAEAGRPDLAVVRTALPHGEVTPEVGAGG